MLLSAQSISKVRGVRTLFEGVSLSLDEGERVGLIGPNGAGKSTLLKLLARAADHPGGDASELAPDAGTVTWAKGLRAVYVPQQDVFGDDSDEPHTAREVVVRAGEAGGSAAGVHDRHEAEVLAEMILSRIGFDEVHADAAPLSLSGGWRKRLSIARALASCGGEPDLLLLDEPTNHLDLEGIQWLEDLLLRPQGGSRTFASVFVTHDRAFLENVATRVVELSPAYPLGTLSAQGNYTEFLRRKSEFLAGQAKAAQALSNQVRKDLDWLSRKPEARRTKSKSKIFASYERQDTLAELNARNAAANAGGAKVDFSATGRKTNKLLAASGITKSLGGRTLFRDVEVELGPGACLGLLGPNGSGKTTLIRVLTGELEPDAGTIKRCDPPPRVVIFSQHRQDFEPSTLLREALCPVSDQVRFQGQSMHITSWSRRFLFRDEQLAQPVGSLSGGELARVHIARLMLEPADVLVLDEPTNDLDIPTLQMFEEALEDFPGALVLVTHDRAMLARLATEVLLLDGKGGAKVFAHLDQALAAQRAGAESGSVAPAKPAPPAPPPPPQAQKKKLTYNEQREFDSIEAKIHAAEAEATRAEQRVNAASGGADHREMAEACRELEEVQARIAALYERWAELEAKSK